MRLVEVVRAPTAGELDDVRGFLTRAARGTGGRALSDHLWLDLLSGGQPGFIGVRVVAPGGVTVAYAQISAASGGVELELVTDPAQPSAVTDGRDAAETALDTFARDGGGDVTWWTDDPEPRIAALAARFGLAPTRTLHEMRRALPLDARSSIVTRAFRPGTDDEAAFLAVNNRAFEGHPEQGGWTADTLASRLAQPWFDPAGFRLYEAEGLDGGGPRLAGFCWTKVHPPAGNDPELGEIYVIGVDPAFHGRGLGRELTLAGLDSLTDRGVRTANLYVDAANSAAMALYGKLGFHIHRTRTAFTGHVSKGLA
jgi:mycothiol synthase